MANTLEAQTHNESTSNQTLFEAVVHTRVLSHLDQPLGAVMGVFV